MADPLDIDLQTLFNDPAARHVLDNAIRSIQLDQGCSYVDALERLHLGADASYDHAVSASAQLLDQEQQEALLTLRGALTRANVDVDYAGEAMTLLDRRDAAVTAAAQRSSKALRREETDPFGRVMLDRKSGPKLDADGRLMSRKDFERRLERARKVEPRYAGDEGRKLFEDEDGTHLAAGLDLVRTLERPYEEQRAQTKAQTIARQLDQAIAAAGDKRQALKQLEADVAQLDGDAAGVSLDGVRDQLKTQAGDATSEPVRMLDTMESRGLRMLDQGKKSKKAKKAEKKRRRLEALKMDGEALYEETHRRLKLLDRPQTDFLKVLDQVLEGKPAPEPRATEPSEPTAPPGVDPASHDLHQRVVARMRELDAPESEYTRVLEQILSGAA